MNPVPAAGTDSNAVFEPQHEMLVLASSAHVLDLPAEIDCCVGPTGEPAVAEAGRERQATIAHAARSDRRTEMLVNTDVFMLIMGGKVHERIVALKSEPRRSEVDWMSILERGCGP